ncbi:hypothetical protein EXIGLDRAFT_843766 [Exidia glandulosa HHB12029]|uniref:Uncharacterized protein n=1 Tax=Exidia glandulosa HHB12029 TaxID=1314781 RepID=A0A165CGM4_EXIGL|nr:hypothetical protein EXIGLDRAFT_843766 [Exidia glandulosa HHB12029]
MLAVDGLQFDTHNVEVAVSASSTAEFHFNGGGITMGVNGRGASGVMPVTFDDQDAAWSLSPGRKPASPSGWDTATSSRLYQNTGTFICPYGEGGPSASYTFVGAGGVVLNGYVWRDSHAFSILLDGETHNVDATSLWLDGTAVLLAKGNLDPTATHTITIVNYNSDDPNCTKEHPNVFCCVGFDSLVLLQGAT